MSELASEPVGTRTNYRNHPETHPAPQAPTRGGAPARGQGRLVEGLPLFWGRDSPMLGGGTGGVIPPGENTVRMGTPSASEVAP
jgi:hypothetical protein